MHTRTSRTLTALAAAATLVLSTSPAGATTPPDASHTVTPGTTFRVTGNGYGHGHGMSQWGARGAATAGQSFQQILAFYYPGTTLSSASGKVRVLVTADNDNNLKIAATRGLRVNDLGNGRTYRLKKAARAWRMKSVAGQTRVYFKTRHWHLYKTGGRKALAGDGELRSVAGPLTLKLPGGSTRIYRGKLRFTQTDTVNVVRLDKYVRGVIPSEMPYTWPDAALRAQAVAARTYAVRERADHATRSYDLCDSAACQVYNGVVAEHVETNRAADGTAGQVLSYGGQYAFAQFSSSNGGWSSDGGQPYLQAFADPYDASVHPYVHWTADVDPAKLQAAYPQIGTISSVQIMAREGGRAFDAGGWVQTVRLVGSSGSVDISGATFRSVYGLRSAYFTFETVS